MQGPEPAVPDVAVALPVGGRAEPAGLELRGRGAGAARQERPLDGQRPLHLPRRQRRQGGRRGHAAEAACRGEHRHGQKVMGSQKWSPWIRTDSFYLGQCFGNGKEVRAITADGGQNFPTKVFVLLHSNISGT